MKPALSRILVTGLAVAMGGGIIWAAWRFDQSLPQTSRQRNLPVEEMVAPAPLTQEQRDALRAGGSAGNAIQLDQGAWVQVAGKDGRVAQQYVASKIDPQSGAFMSMEEPRAVFYMDDGRVATLRAQGGRVHVPNRALESGSFEGDVVVRMYRPNLAGTVDLVADAPALILETDRLDFDQVLGQLACPEAFRLTTDLLTFDGSGLDLLLSADQRSIQRLSVEHPLGPIVIDRAKVGARGIACASATVDHQLVALKDQQGKPPAQGPASGAPPAAPVSPPESFYRLELHDDVEAVRFTPIDRSWTRGETLTAIFTLRNDLIAKEVVQHRGDRAVPVPANVVATRPMGALANLAAFAVAQQGPSQGGDKGGDLLVIRFTGQLLMEPANSRDPLPERSQDMRIDIDGKEVEMATTAGMALRASSVDIDLARDGTGRTAPKLIVAKGDVEATDTLQSLWCSELRSTFAPSQAAPASGADDPVMGNAQMARVDARGGIQVQLKDGARVMGASMVAHPSDGRAELQGPGITLYRAGVVIEGMPQLFVNERTRTAEAPAGGRARSWADPIIAPDAKGRVPTPQLPATTPQLDANWLGRMTYIDNAAAGATLDLSGGVKVRAQPRSEEFDALDAVEVHLEFVRERTAGVIDAPSAPSTGSGGEVRARRLVATGDVRLENQLWTTAERKGEPRLFQVRGPRVEYDAQSGEAAVAGSGTVLIHLPAGSSTQARSGENRQRDSAIAGGGVEGTSRFRWGSAMNLRHLVDDQYLMTMDQSVELVRAGFASGDTMSLTTDRLEATLARAPGAQPTRADEPFNLGGSSELLRVRGVGRCFIRVPQYDIECEEFDYDIVTQVAQLRAKPGRMVNVLPKGQGSPIRAAAMTLDMATGRVQIRSGSGAVGR